MASTGANSNGNPEQGISSENLFPLDAPEFAVRFRRGTNIFRHVFRRITAADWDAYHAAVIVEHVEDRSGGDKSFDQDAASFVLYQRTILRVEGYQTRDGRKPEELPTWPDCIPQEHRLFAIGLLLENIGALAGDTFQVAGNSVSFVVIRDDDESPSKQFFGVTHHFHAPAVGQRRRFLDAVSKSDLPQRMLRSLYDELIASAEGYSVGGVPIAHEQLPHEMCCGHKVYAIAALFFSFGDCGPEPRRTRAVTLPAEFLGTKKTVPMPRAEVH